MLAVNQIIDISSPGSSAGQVPLVPPYGGTTTVYYGLDNRRSLDHAEGDSRLAQESRLDLAATKLDAYFGLAVVLDLVGLEQPAVDARYIILALESWRREVESQGVSSPPTPERVLLRAGSVGSRPAFLTADAALFLVSQGVRLVGLEGPSVDETGSRRSVEALFRTRDVVWIVNLSLGEASSNFPYFLCSTPLVADVKGAVPSRAVLLRFDRTETGGEA